MTTSTTTTFAQYPAWPGHDRVPQRQRVLRRADSGPAALEPGASDSRGGGAGAAVAAGIGDPLFHSAFWDSWLWGLVFKASGLRVYGFET